MRRFLFLLALLVFVSCSGDAVKRIVPAEEDDPETVEETAADNEAGEEEDETGETADEASDPGEIPETGDEDNGGPQETEESEPLPDAEEPDTEEPDTEEPDTEEPDTEVPDTEEPDEDLPECVEVFNGGNCARAACETVADCCEADLCVATDGCGGAKVCRNAFFKDNFDSYTSGSFPPDSSGWQLKYVGAGGWYQAVNSERYNSAYNSMRLLGSKSKNNSAVMTAALPEVPDVINVEMMVNTQGDDVSFSLCTFNGSGQWGNYDMKVVFANGKITYQIPEWTAYDVTSSYEADKWYKIRLKFNQPDKTVSVWVNDELKVSNQQADYGSISIPNLCLTSDKNDKQVWFDDIFVWGE